MGSKSVFLSYTSQDAAAAGRLGEALRVAGAQVWFDQAELRGGEVWDQSIRQHIRDCRLFVPIISRGASERGEGYFRLEWKLAVDRSHLMAQDEPFIVPVVIDDSSPIAARVPDRFHDYQWSRLPAGEATPEFIKRVLALTGGLQNGLSNEAEPAAESKSSPSLSRKSLKRAMTWSIAGSLLVLITIAAVLALGHRAVKPYSAQDRRMTFAVLPFIANAGNAQAAEAAAANTDACTAALERNTKWAQTSDRAAVREVAARLTHSREIAHALNVHFLFRGIVSRSNDGFVVNLSVIDGETERTLGDETITVSDPALTPSSTSAYRFALGSLIFEALKMEVQRSESLDENQLDVRDLTFRAYVYFYDHSGEQARKGYETAERLMDRALKLAPNDALALRVTAEINLCDCLSGWMGDTTKATAIGAAAVDRLSRIEKDPPYSSRLKLLQLGGRWAEMLSVSDQALAKEPDDFEFLSDRALALLHLGRAEEALSMAPKIESNNVHNYPGFNAFLANVAYAASQNETAVKYARAATASMSAEDMRNPDIGAVRLTLAAAQARLGKLREARATLEEFQSSVPEAKSISAMRKWIAPNADLYGFEALFTGLRLAAVPE